MLSKTARQEKEASKRALHRNHTQEELARLASLPLRGALCCLGSTLAKSDPLRLLFVAQGLGKGPHKDKLADLLRIRFAEACFNGSHREAKRAQEALGALLGSTRAFFACSCPPVEIVYKQPSVQKARESLTIRG